MAKVLNLGFENAVYKVCIKEEGGERVRVFLKEKEEITIHPESWKRANEGKKQTETNNRSVDKNKANNWDPEFICLGFIDEPVYILS